MLLFLPRCMQCRRSLTMRKLSVCLSVCLSNAWIVTKRKKDLPLVYPENVSGSWKCMSSPLGELTLLPPNPLARFEGPLRGGKEREEKEARKGKEGKGREKTPPLPNKLLVGLANFAWDAAFNYRVTVWLTGGAAVLGCNNDTEYTCMNSKCIPLTKFNDSINDCGDNSDECRTRTASRFENFSPLSLCDLHACAAFLPRCMECRRGIAMRILSVRLSVWSVSPSVRLSVTRVDCDKTIERSVQIYISYERTFRIVFWEEEWLVGGDPFYLKFWVNRPR